MSSNNLRIDGFTLRIASDVLSVNECSPARGSGTTGQGRLTEISIHLELACLLPVLSCLLSINVSGIGGCTIYPIGWGRSSTRADRAVGQIRYQ